MRVTIRSIVLAAAALGLLPLGGAQAQPFPSRPITIVVPFAAGGTADVAARLLAERMTAELGQPVLVDNRAGGNGVIGAQAVARSRPDGHMLLSISTTHTIIPTLMKDAPPYDLKKDFAPVWGYTEVPQAVIVPGKSGHRTMADLVAAARAMPAGVNFGSSGSGTLSHLTSARLLQDLRLRGTHVPYKGLSPLAQAVVGDQVHFGVANVSEILELAKSGHIQVLGVTAEKRLPYLPQVPTLLEQGLIPDLIATSWQAYVAPAGTPKAVLDRLQASFAKAAADPGVLEKLGKLGVVVQTRTQEGLAGHMQSQGERWRKVIEDNQIKADN